MASGSVSLGVARGRGSDGFWDTWLAHEPTLRRLCASIYRGRPDDAEDLLRASMARAWDRWATDGPQVVNPGAWLHELTRNVSLTHRRNERRREELLPKVFDRVRHDAEPIEEAVHRRQLLARAMQEIDRLQPSIREPFMAFALYGQSYTEVAQTYGLTVGAVGRRINRARQILAAALGNEERSAEADRSDRSDASEASDRSDRSDKPDRSDRSDWSAVVGPLLDEIAWHLRDTCVIQVRLETGGTLEYHAVFEQGLGRRKQRIQSLEAYVAKHDRGWRRRFELASLLIAENRHGEAAKHLRRVLELQPRHLPSSLRLGQMLVLLRRLDEAVAIYQAALGIAASPATRHHLEGLIERARSGVFFPQYATAQRVEHLQHAVNAFRAAIAVEPRNISHYHELALTYETWGKPVQAVEAYDAALEVDANDVFALARSHNPLTAQGLHHLVLPRLERAVELDPNYTYALKLLVDRRANMGMVRGAEGRRTLALARRLVERNPDSADAMDAFTRYYEFRGEFDHAVGLWREFLTRNPGNAKAWTFYGTSLERSGNIEAAADAYSQSYNLDPGWLDVYWRGLPVLIATGRHDEARRWTDELAERLPNHWDACIRIGEHLLSLGESADIALAHSRRAVELAPDMETSWRNYGDLLLRAGRPAEALEVFQRAWEIAQRSTGSDAPWSRMQMGCALKALGRRDEAIDVLREFEQLARARRAFDPHYEYMVGRAKMEMDDFAGAERAFRRSMKAGAWFARYALDELRQRRDQHSFEAGEQGGQQP